MNGIQHHSGSTVHVDGADIYFELAGNDRGPPLLLLHGGLGSIEDFGPLAARGLGTHHRLVCIDSRGHGRSTLGDERLTYERLERDVRAVLSRLGIQSTAILGFSDGGVVGYRLALSGAISVTSLATIGAGHDLAPDDPVRPILERVTADSWLRRFPGADQSYARVNPQPDFRRLVGAVVQMWLDTSPTGYPGDAVARLRAPLLVLRGDEDHLFGRHAAASLADRVHGAVLANLPFAAHAAHADQPQMVTEIVTEFLRRSGPDPALRQ